MTAPRVRTALLATTALSTALATLAAAMFAAGLSAGGAAAQVAPNARPQGGQVVAGSATIGTAPNATTINQTTQRAAINWQSFNVGSNQAVVFQQPSATAMTLNRVVGPDPSAIAGRITANGGIIITNQSGVVFHAGAQVDATSLVVSAPGITTPNFMAGHLVFDQPAKAGAAVANDGTITIKQAGLGALVAPQVRNAGTITAKLGHVVLAGAAATTLDLYGDGLVAIDVTRQVTTAPSGQQALVINTGVIRAAGGTVQLTAAAADGVVSNLVDASGHISAATVGQRLGTIAINGTGGALLVEGSVRANGGLTGVQGGAIEVAGNGGVVIGQHAQLSAAARSGGGTVAIGTTLARARGGPGVMPTVVAQSVSVAAGARISADAGHSGNGGRVTLLSSHRTTLDGQITARGGSAAGDGGTVEVSSKGDVGLTGSVDVSAAHGNLGTILLDPATLTVTQGGGENGTGSADTTLSNNGGTLQGNQPDSYSDQTVSNTAIQALRGNIVLQATTLVTVAAAITLNTAGQSLTIQSAGNLNVNARINTAGDINLEANSSHVTGAPATGTGALSIGTGELVGPVSTTGGSVTLSGATIGIGSSVAASAAITVTSLAGVNVSRNTASLAGGGNITIDGGTGSTSLAAPVVSANGNVQISGSSVNAGSVQAAGSIGITATTGGFFSNDATSPLLAGGDLTINSAGQVNLSAPATSTAGSVFITGSTVQVAAAVTAASLINVTGTGPVNSDGFSGVSTVGNGVLSATGNITISSADYVRIGPAVVSSAGNVSVTGASYVNIFDPITAAAGREIIVAAPTVLVAATLTVPGSLATPQAGGPVNVLLQTDQLTMGFTDSNLPQTGALVVAPGGIVAVEPFTAGNPMSVNNAAVPPGLVVTTADLARISTIGPVGGSTVSGGLFLGGTGGAAGRTAGSVTIAAPLNVTAIAGTLGVFADGPVSEPANIVTAGTLVGVAGSVALPNANNIPALGAFTAATGFALTTTVPLTVAGPVTGTSSQITLNAPSMTITGAVAAPIVALTATGGGAITEPAGVLTTGTLTGSAGSASLPGANLIVTLGSFTTTSGFALNNAVSLAVAGPVSDQASVTLGALGAITLTGNVGAPLVALTATAGAITQTAGTLTAASLTVDASAGAQFGTPAPAVAAIGTLGSVTTGGGFTLANAVPLSVAGLLSAPEFQISAPGQITLVGGTITTTGALLAAQSGTAPPAQGNDFLVTPVNGTGRFTQTGTTTIAGLPATTATVRIDIPANGTISLSDLAANAADIVLASTSGSLVGNLFVNNLLVIGSTGAANLAGSVLGVAGKPAAALGQIQPAINANYLLNGCVIALANCGAPPPTPPPIVPTPPTVPSVPVITPLPPVAVIAATPPPVVAAAPIPAAAAPAAVNLSAPTSTLLLPAPAIVDLSEVLTDATPSLLLSSHLPGPTLLLDLAFPPTVPGDSNPDILLPNVSGRDY